MACRLYWANGNGVLGVVHVGFPFEDQARKARFHFGVNPRFDDLPKLLAKVRDVIEPGKFEGFERRLGATQQVFEVWLRVTHVGSPGYVEVANLPRSDAAATVT